MNSPQEAAVASLLGPALVDFLELPHLFSKWPMASECDLKSECELEGSARLGRAAAATGQLPIFRLKPVLLKRINESASKGEGDLEVKRGMERCLCNAGQFRKAYDFLNKCAAELPSILASDQDPVRILHDDLWSRRLLAVEHAHFRGTSPVHETWVRTSHCVSCLRPCPDPDNVLHLRMTDS